MITMCVHQLSTPLQKKGSFGSLSNLFMCQLHFWYEICLQRSNENGYREAFLNACGE